MSTEEPGPVEGQPSEEELRAALEEQMRRITVQDVLLQSVVTLINLAGRKLGLAGEDDAKDLEQAKLAIESSRALLPYVPEEHAGPIKDALSQVQMAYAREAQGGGATPAAAPGEPGAQPESGAEQPPEDAERAKARSKLWTPPGS
ncbi:MAG: hypothetical protein QOE08_2144 [Thermoleophilaceae bacterium]|jgi:hypothetical protein|nr:hypothetical protein [Thermoleophilaceae bacterium]